MSGLKVHLPCGDVYLKGYINCDIDGEPAPEGPKVNETTLDKYFNFPFGAPRRPIYVDQFMDALQPWPFADGSVEELVSLSFIEHFWPKDLPFIIQQIERVMQPGGRWIVDFPDVRGTVLQYYETDPQFCFRLIYCNHKNQYSIHHWGYTPETFAQLLTPGVWTVEEKCIVQHDYPTISMIATKT